MSAEDAAEMRVSDAVKRFVLRRRIGEGAFGVVWEAYDRDRGARVALKSLMHTDASALLLFKKEFRALADMVHPNLVTLYELLTFGEQWFFTMEFVEGTDFLKFVTSPLLTHVPVISHGPGDLRLPSGGGTPPTSILGSVDEERTLGLLKNGASFEWYNEPTVLDPKSNGAVESDPTMKVRFTPVPFAEADVFRFDADLLRAALRQLAAGLTTLHEAGKLHRDIKPSNVLVTREGRVVILDFGLVTELSEPGSAHTRRAIVGTPIFMSPEQGLGEPLTPASDWYSVGVMLYRALTGRVPFDGPPMHVLMSKAEVEAVPPGVIVPGLPQDLESLCTDLLRRNPLERPTGEDIMSRLGVESSRAITVPEATSTLSRSAVFVGRETHLAVMKQAFEAVKSKRPAAALVYGGSGMGKSSLIRKFLQQVKEQRDDAVILRGRCYQRESVPYKALDSLVDELSVYLQDLPMVEATALMPRDVDALMRLFPVLRQVEVPTRQAQAAPIVNPHELRRRAFGALRDLLARIAERHPLILTIDDLQWGDADSDALLSEIVRPPDPPALLLIATFRADEVGSAPLMKALRPATGAPVFDVHELPVGEFTPQEAQRLAIALLGPKASGRAESIAREAEGNPLFIDALARHAQLEMEGAMRRSTPPSGLRLGVLGAPIADAPPIEPYVKLGEMIQARVARLPPGARKLLETLVVAGSPLDVTLARRAAGAESHEPAVLSLLMVMHLVRPPIDSPGDEVEIYHDRIRESVLATIPPEDQRTYHDRLAVTLELDGRADPELLCTHYHAAGRTVKALFYALKAADEAFDALAFDRAARLYRLALSLNPPRDVPILTRLGESLANAGRGAESADVYLAAAEKSPPNAALDLRHRAAEQLLISGHVDRGLNIVRFIVEPLKMKLAASQKGALFSLLTRRAHLRLRGLGFKERREEEIPPEELMKIDVCWAVAVGLSLVDSMRGAEFQARHLLLALQAGEPYRIARALAVEVAFSASNGAKGQDRTDELLRMTESLAQRIKKPHALALATTMAGAAKYLAGKWREGLELTERGAAMLREQCSGVTWELDTADIFVLTALNMLGRWKDLSDRLDEVVRSADARGDLYAAVHIRLEVGYVRDLARDDPGEAARSMDEALARCSHQEGFQMQHSLHLQAMSTILLYRGDVEEAFLLLEKHWSDLRRAFILEFPMARVAFSDLRARAALACAARDDAPPDKKKAWLKSAMKDIATMEAERAPWVNAMAALLRASAAAVRGAMSEARALAVAAEAALGAADMGVLALVALRRRGELIGGSEGDELVAEADRGLRAQQIKAPERVAAMFAPGRWRASR